MFMFDSGIFNSGNGGHKSRHLSPKFYDETLTSPKSGGDPRMMGAPGQMKKPAYRKFSESKLDIEQKNLFE